MSEELKFHPLADIFPLMEGEEFDALVGDIKANGLREHIVLHEERILDGRNRYRACLTAGVPVKIGRTQFMGITDPVAYVISANIHRRHLTGEQKRELIAKLVKAQPEKSNRQIAKTAKVDHKTVAAVREAEEARGEIPHAETRTDTKGRKQSAKKKKGRGTIRRENKDTAEKIGDLIKATINLLGRDLDLGLISLEDAERTARSAATAWTSLAERYRLRLSPSRDGENAGDPEASADVMKAKFANDDGLDIPEYLRRVPKAAAS